MSIDTIGSTHSLAGISFSDLVVREATHNSCVAGDVSESARSPSSASTARSIDRSEGVSAATFPATSQQAIDSDAVATRSQHSFENGSEDSLTETIVSTDSNAEPEIDKNITALQHVAVIMPDDDAEKPSMLNYLGKLYLERFKKTGALTDVDAAISALHQAIALALNDTEKLSLLSNLIGLLQHRSGESGALSDLNETITAQQHAISITADSDEHKPSYLENLRSSLNRRFERLDTANDIDEAIAAQRLAIDLTPNDHVHKPDQLNDLGNLFARRFRRFRAAADIHEAIFSQQQAIALMPEGHAAKPIYLNNLGNSLSLRFMRMDTLADIDEAIELQRQAVSLAPDGAQSTPGWLCNLGNSLGYRFDRLGHLSDIHEAISVQQRALVLAPDGHPLRLMCLNNLGTSFVSRFERLGAISDIDEGISAQKEAIALTPNDSADKHSRLSNLGISLARRFERLGTVTNIDEAISAQLKAVELTPDGHANRPLYLSNLGNSYSLRFDRSGSITDIDEAIRAKQQAVALMPEGHPGKALCISNLGASLDSRFQRLGEFSDLDDAIKSHSQAVELTDNNHPDKPWRLSNLGESLTLRYKRLGTLSDIDEAVSVHERAVALSPDGHASKPVYLNNLGNAYKKRFHRLGNITDIDKSISLAQRAVSLTADDHASKPLFLNSLGTSLSSRFQRFGDITDLNDTISAEQQAIVLTPDGHASKARWLLNLASSYTRRFERLGTQSDLENGTNTYSQSVRSQSGPPSTMFHAARHWARCSLVQHGKPLLDAHASIISLIPRIIWLGTDISRRYEDILSIGDAVNEAVAAAVQLGKLDLALEWMEQGRSIVWGQILSLRTPIDDLKASLRPDLAHDLVRVSFQLEQAGIAKSLRNSPQDSDKLKTSMEAESQNHRRLAARYEQLLGEIQQFPGFERFLRPKKLSELRSAATTGSVVIINVHKTRCDALILRNPTAPVIHVPLHDCSYSTVKKLRGDLIGFLVKQGVRVRGELDADDGRASKQHRAGGHSGPDIKDVLKVLWEQVVSPIMFTLGHTKQSDPEVLPRITWCATGPLAFLPLHAAGCYATPDEPKVFQYVVSSYTPTLTALVKALEKPSQTSPRILAVSQPNTAYCSRLPGTVTEVEAIKSCIGDRELNWLNGEDATVASVLEAMYEYGWCHLACHGIQDTKDPMKSKFALHDGALDLKTIMNKTFKHAEMAFLSACQTATGDENRPEEAAHLAAGMLAAGYRTVYATMWSIGDKDGPVVAKAVYSYLLNGSGRGNGKEAYALHQAMETLRNKVGEDAFVKWLPFVHFGA